VIHVFRWDGKEGIWGGPELIPPKGEIPPCLWIDLECPTEAEERLVFDKYFPVHVLTLEDITRPRRLPDNVPHFPKAEEFPDYLFVISNPLTQNAVDVFLDKENTGPLNSQLSAILTQNILITHHCQPLNSVTALHTYLTKHPTQAERGPDYLFHIVLDDSIDLYVPLLDAVDDSLDRLEERVFTRPDRKLLARLLTLKRSIILLRKTMIYEREVLARLCRGEFKLIEQREVAYYRNVYDHIIRFTELIEASREMVMDLMQTLLASQANRLNEIMKVLTMISVTILPMSLIAGIYGMNFQKNIWPDFESSPYGFVIALVMMALSGLAALGLFRWMKWV
jgi:magnesium transporter